MWVLPVIHRGNCEVRRFENISEEISAVVMTPAVFLQLHPDDYFYHAGILRAFFLLGNIVCQRSHVVQQFNGQMNLSKD